MNFFVYSFPYSDLLYWIGTGNHLTSPL